jgi:PAS domain S-box-containing protein
MAAAHLICSHNYALVALSVLIAMFASYAALDLAGRVTAAGGWVRAVWLLGGAGAMGTGIWSMHYIGMLACILPVPVAYHWPTVLLSLLAAILASAIALYVVSGQKMGAFRAFVGSVLMGGGIASMHYIGMAGMRLAAICHYDSLLVVLSVVFAVLISLAALWITFHLRDEKAATGLRKTAGAVVMGAAIPVMHYTGMAAAHFTPSGMSVDLSRAISISALGTAGIAAVTFIVLGLALLTSWVDRRFAAQALELQERKLQRSEAYLAEAQRLTHTGSWAFNAITPLYWSEENFRIWGFDPQQGLPDREAMLQRIHPEDRDRVVEHVQNAVRERRDYALEFRIVLPDGAVRYIHGLGHTAFSASGEFVEVVGTNVDVTERKRAEMLLGGEKRLLEMIARGDPRALILDALCRLVEELASGAWSSILLLDRKANRLRHGAAPSLPVAYTKAIDGLVIGPGVGSCGTAAYRAEPVIVSDITRDPLWADFRDLARAHGLQACWSTPVLSSAGRVLGTFAIYYREPRSPTPQEHNLIDRITHLASIAVEREQAEEALRHAQAELAHMTRLTTMGELTASIAHEVYQPLTAIVNNANACLGLLDPAPKRTGEGRDGGVPNLEEVREALAEIVGDANRASAVIMRVRQLAKRAPIEKSLLDLKAVVNDVLALASYELATRRVTIRTDLPQDLPSVSGDRVQLQQVLLNLVMNGMDAMNSVEEQNRILVLFGKHDGTAGTPAVLLCVQDAGIGFKPEETDQLFEAFYTTKPQGMGMGLAISRSIIEAHGGRLWAEQNAGPGATFSFRLPAITSVPTST